MKPLVDQDFYKLLEVPRGGTPKQIERAYRIARVTWEPSSTATYSVFSTDETAAILRRIEEAYAVLSDPQLRREYDARLRSHVEQAQVASSTEVPLEATVESSVEPSAEPPELRITAERVAPQPPLRAPPKDSEPEVELDESLEPSDGVYDGTVLRAVRMSLGIELEEISTLTKVNEDYLNNIEANEYEALPATVYVRGFVKEYAKSIGLSPTTVAESYLQRMKASLGVRD